MQGMCIAGNDLYINDGMSIFKKIENGKHLESPMYY